MIGKNLIFIQNIILNKNLELIKNKYKEIELVDPVNKFLLKTN